MNAVATEISRSKELSFETLEAPMLPSVGTRIKITTANREVAVDGIELLRDGNRRSISNLDQQPVEVQIAAERELEAITPPPIGHSWTYQRRNRFEALFSEEAGKLRVERLNDAESLSEKAVGSPRLSEGSILLTLPDSCGLSPRIAQELGVAPTTLILEKFPNSETRVEVHESVRDKHAFVIAGMEAPVNEAFMETVLLVQALKLADARRITVILPYFAYSRQDRKADIRPPISARMVTDTLKVAGAHQILTVDLHATQVEGFFDGPFENLSGLGQMIPPAIREEGSNLVVISPDAGGAKRAEKLARQIEHYSGVFTPLVVMSKFRSGPSVEPTVTLTAGTEVLAGKTCVLVDDMIDTGGSIIAAARALKECGAARVIVFATHGIYSRNAIDRLSTACDAHGKRFVDRMYVTDTLRTNRARSDFMRCVSIAPLIAEAISRLDHPMGSLRELKDRCDFGSLLPTYDRTESTIN